MLTHCTVSPHTSIRGFIMQEKNTQPIASRIVDLFSPLASQWRQQGPTELLATSLASQWRQQGHTELLATSLASENGSNVVRCTRCSRFLSCPPPLSSTPRDECMVAHINTPGRTSIPTPATAVCTTVGMNGGILAGEINRSLCMLQLNLAHFTLQLFNVHSAAF